MIGRTISHYEILDKIGEGGMGIVYRAHDTKLNRTVALKFLPQTVALSETDRKRFIHEAQAASVLDHPNICTIFEFNETSDGLLFIAMPAYEGTPLNKRIDQGPHSIDEAIDIAIKIADGLQAAHEKGIVHRDIKSSNIFITQKGQVKVLDFGLARGVGMTQVTKTGMTMGTVPYMSPEQARGEKVDHRTDIWSLGVILYEMITGRMPFRGDYNEAIVYQILNEEPETVTSLRSNVPMELEHLIQRAMEKNPKDRFQSALDLSIELKRVRRDASKETKERKKEGREDVAEIIPVRKGKRFQPRFILIVSGLIVLFLISLFLFYSPSPVRVIDTQPIIDYTPVTFSENIGWHSGFDISPDGEYVAYIERFERVMVKKLNAGEPFELFRGNVTSLRWSPNSRELYVSVSEAVYEERRLEMYGYIITLVGDYRRRLPWCDSPSWSPDGKRIACFGYQNIKFIDVTTGETNFIGPIEEMIMRSVTGIDWSSKERLVFISDNIIWTIDEDGTQLTKILEDDHIIAPPRWSSDGDAIYYLRRAGATGDLFKIDISPSTGTAVGSPQLVFRVLQATGPFSIDHANNRLLYLRKQEYSNLFLLTLEEINEDEPYKIHQLTRGMYNIGSPRFSPDGQQIAFHRGDHRHINIFTISKTGDNLKQITFFDSQNKHPVWSPDGREIAFISNQTDSPLVWKFDISAGVSRNYENTNTDILQYGTLSWSPYSDIIYRNRRGQFTVLEPVTGNIREIFDQDSFIPTIWKEHKVSHDQKFMATRGLWIIDLETSPEKLHNLSEDVRMRPLQWSEDNQWIYGVQSDKFIKYNITTGEIKDISTLSNDSYELFHATPDGRNIIAVIYESQYDLWLIENFDPTVR